MSANLKQRRPLRNSEFSYLARTEFARRRSSDDQEPPYVDLKLIADSFIAGSAYRTPASAAEFKFDPSTSIYVGMSASSLTDWVPQAAVTATAGQYNRALADKLCQEHPEISTYPGIFGGTPHIKGVRMSVGDVLSELYLQGSINAVAGTFSLDENQIKEAIAFAQDFIESALSPRSEVDG